MGKLHFCVDIDNVIGQTDRVMRDVIAEYTGGRVTLRYEDIRRFNYSECPDALGNTISKVEWKEVHELFSHPRFLWRIEPLPGAVGVLQQLAHTHSVHLATARLPIARRTTVEWLDSIGLGTLDLHFLKHGEKHSHLRHFDAAVEDDYEQAKAFALGGTTCYLLRHPWNADCPAMDRVTWVDDWIELAAHLEPDCGIGTPARVPSQGSSG